VKKIPMRMCVACRIMQPKRDLIRIVKTADGKLVVDPTGKCNGRGAYICRKEECLNKALKSKAIERALEAPASPELLLRLKEAMGDGQT